MNKDTIIEVDDTQNIAIVNSYLQLAQAILR